MRKPLIRTAACAVPCISSKSTAGPAASKSAAVPSRMRSRGTASRPPFLCRKSPPDVTAKAGTPGAFIWKRNTRAVMSPGTRIRLRFLPCTACGRPCPGRCACGCPMTWAASNLPFCWEIPAACPRPLRRISARRGSLICWLFPGCIFRFSAGCFPPGTVASASFALTWRCRRSWFCST